MTNTFVPIYVTFLIFALLLLSVWQAHINTMVSYKKLNPEDVQFSSASLSEESHPTQEEVAVSSYRLSLTALITDLFFFYFLLVCLNYCH